MQCPKAVVFDLDNTLADPHCPVSEEMAARLERVIAHMPVAVMSAASLERIEQDVVARLRKTDLARLSLFAANAAQAYTYRDGAWHAQYRHGFTDQDRPVIKSVLEEVAKELGILEHRAPYGAQFIDYEGYLAFTALGIDAPVEERRRWDPNGEKRKKMQSLLQEKLPDVDIFIGGLTTIDITPKGINKSHGVMWYAQTLGILPQDMLYVGDALYEGGNDAAVLPTGIQTRATSGPSETLAIIEDLLAACS